MECPVLWAVRSEDETRVQIKVVAHCTSAVKGGTPAATMRQMTGARYANEEYCRPLWILLNDAQTVPEPLH